MILINTLQFNAAGITHVDPYIIWILYQNHGKLDLYLVREPENKHDKNAIKICATHPWAGGEFKAGYVPASIAAKIAPLMDKQHAKCIVKPWGLHGGHKNDAGVFLNPGIHLTVKIYV